MAKEIKMYESKDGTLFKTKKGAENHDKKEIVNQVLTNLKMTKDEVSEKLQILSKRNFVIKGILKNEPDWTKWYTHHIMCINEDLFKDPKKKTIYVRKYKQWGKDKEDILFTELTEDFTSPELHCGDEWKVDGVECIDEFNSKVYYDYKYSWEERMLKKIINKDELDESEIKGLVNELPIVYEEEGEDRRWSKSMLSVVELRGNLYAIEWEKGLTENQENSYYDQPYPVELKKEERIIKTIVTTVVKK